ncbi:MAG: glycoside hydrolase family 3 N-terminal domain-containing protein [Candidatus Promineifilaceae bacterium]
MEQTSKQKSHVYHNPDRSIEARIIDLLARMTLEEKVAQLGSAWSFTLLDEKRLDRQQARQILFNGIGQITRIGGATTLSPAEGAKFANEIQHFLVNETRLGIPAIVHEECCSGYMARNATCFPQTIGLASTWEPELAQAMAEVVRQQMRAAGAHQGLSPLLDVARDARWGRVEETFGEDPVLVAAMGVSFVRGLQGANWNEGVVATAKHFAGYGRSLGGFNWAPAHIPPRELRDVYLYPFEAAVRESHLQSVMNGYHELDGVPCAASTELLTDILVKQWGFDGVVVSDYFAIEQLQTFHHISSGKAHSARLALAAGLDVELPGTDCYGQALIDAVRSGEIAEGLVDRSVLRVLRHKFLLGLFENPFVDAQETITLFDTPPQRQLAREIAHKSMVLLKNEDGLLPLPKDLRRIAVIGPQANNVRHLLGDYAYPCHIETLIEMAQGDNVFNMPISGTPVDLVENFVPIEPLLAGIKEAVGVDTVIDYAKGCDVTGSDMGGFADAVAAAQGADVALLFVGGKSGLTNSCTSGEARDRHEINLPGVQQQLVEAVVATGTPVVVILINGRPLSITWIDEHVPAILEAWLPGEEGAAAVADILFGDVSPGGKLPISFPRDAGQIPVYYSHKPSGGKSHWKETYVSLSNKPLYPFGYGLSYTTFEITDLRLSRERLAAGEHTEVAVTVTNTGDMAGDEVVQLYVHDEIASLTRPKLELKGFKRITLQPGEQRSVIFELPANLLGYTGPDMNTILEPGLVHILIGTASDNILLTGKIEITGETADIESSKQFSSKATIS